MLTLHEARSAAAAAAVLPAEPRSLRQAIGGTLLDDAVVAFDIPHADTSAMDGWAICGHGPWRILSAEPKHPGEALPGLSDGDAVAVVTGSVVPRGTASVLRSEHSGREGQVLHARAETPDLERGRNIRPAGAEARTGDLLLEAGAILSPARAALLAVAGIDEVSVVRRARVALIYTGSEVITSGRPAPGQVRDVFGVALPAMLRGMGAEVVEERRIEDDAGAMDRALGGAETADLVITTGGTAHSRADHLRPALRRAAASTLVDSVDMRPGHPALLARLPDGRHVLGLPGNPLAGFAGLAALGQPLLDAMHGLPAAQARALQRAVAGEDLAGSRAGVRLVPSRLVPSRRGCPGVIAAGHDRSHMMRGIAHADVFAVVPAQGLTADEAVDVLPVPSAAGTDRKERDPWAE